MRRSRTTGSLLGLSPTPVHLPRRSVSHSCGEVALVVTPPPQPFSPLSLADLFKMPVRTLRFRASRAGVKGSVAGMDKTTLIAQLLERQQEAITSLTPVGHYRCCLCFTPLAPEKLVSCRSQPCHRTCGGCYHGYVAGEIFKMKTAFGCPDPHCCDLESAERALSAIGRLLPAEDLSGLRAQHQNNVRITVMTALGGGGGGSPIVECPCCGHIDELELDPASGGVAWQCMACQV
jgi:hypothetical protein